MRGSILLRGFTGMFLVLSAACAGKAPAPEPTGLLTIGVSTTGSGVAALSFAIEVRSERGDSEAPRSERIKADGGIATFRDLPDGPYVVRLALPAVCQADNGASRQVSIVSRRTTAVRFVVTCR